MDKKNSRSIKRQVEHLEKREKKEGDGKKL